MNLAMTAHAGRAADRWRTAAFVGFPRERQARDPLKGASCSSRMKASDASVGLPQAPEFKANAERRSRPTAQRPATPVVSRTLARRNMTNSVGERRRSARGLQPDPPRINFQDLTTHGLYLAPAPGNMNHPFQFPAQGAHDTFKAAVQVWATAEQTAAP